MQGTAEMITVTYPWWAWLLFCAFLIPVIKFSGWLGDKLGHATGRWWVKRRETREAKLTEWSRRG